MLGAGALVMVAASTVLAVQPTYTIDVTKTADPATVPASGGTVAYTVWVENTGTGDFKNVVANDDMCTLDAPTGDTDADGNLDPGEIWAYSCTVDNVMPDTTNTATVFACQNNGDCGGPTHDATGTASVTVTETPATPSPDPTDPGATGPGATEPTTDSEVGALTSGGNNAFIIVLALGMLLASLVLVKPARANRNR